MESDSTFRIVTIGGDLLVDAFRLQGIDGYVASERDARGVIDLVAADPSVGIVFLEKNLYEAHQQHVDAIRQRARRPYVVEIPMQPGDVKINMLADLLKNMTSITFE